MPGPRSREVECFARFHEAHIAAVPGDPEVVNQMAGACCTDRVRNSKGPVRLVIFPRSHIEAALFYSNVSRRDVDINFMGRIHTKQQSANRARRWILDFAKRTFTNASLFLDTTVQNPSTYQRLGAFDISVVEGRAAGFRPMGVMGEQQQNPCVMAKCSTDYFHRLARSRFTLAPAGDKPWSVRDHVREVSVLARVLMAVRTLQGWSDDQCTPKHVFAAILILFQSAEKDDDWYVRQCRR